MIAEVTSDKEQKRVAFSDTFGKIRVVSFKKSESLEIGSETTLHWHAHSIRALKFNSLGYLYSAGQEGVVVLWHGGTRSFVAHLGHRVFDLCFNSDSTLMALTL